MTTPWLDHVALATDDLDRAAAVYRRLGFNLTPRSSHSGDDGPWGTGNHCAMFRDGYFELIGITDPALYHDHLKAALARYTGLHLIALGTDDSQNAYDEAVSRGVAIDEPYGIARQVPHGDSAREGRFHITQVDPAWFPEADFFFCQHHTPDVLWQADLLDHPNGVTGLAGVTLVASDPEATARRVAAVSGVTGTESEDGHRFVLARGTIDVVAAEGLGRPFAGIVPPVLPWVVAVTFTVADPQAIEERASSQGIKTEAAGGGIWIGPDDADGALLVFRT